MSVLGIGGAEVVLLIVLIILILGPERAPQAARAIGKQWRAITRAEWWQSAVQMWHFMRHLPQNLAEIAEVKEMQAVLSDELTQVKSLTQSVQDEVESVSKPVEAVLKGNALQDTLQEMSNELKQSLPQALEGSQDSRSGETSPSIPSEQAKDAEAPLPSASEAPPPPVATPGPEDQGPGSDPSKAPSIKVPPQSNGGAVREPPKGGFTATALQAVGEDVDGQMMALAEQISEQIEQLPRALTRLDELESQHAQLTSQLAGLQQKLDALLAEQG